MVPVRHHMNRETCSLKGLVWAIMEPHPPDKFTAKRYRITREVFKCKDKMMTSIQIKCTHRTKKTSSGYQTWLKIKSISTRTVIKNNSLKCPRIEVGHNITNSQWIAKTGSEVIAMAMLLFFEWWTRMFIK